MYWYQIMIPIIKEVRQTIYTDANQNASLITADFLAVVCKNEQSRTAYLCRGWAISKTRKCLLTSTFFKTFYNFSSQLAKVWKKLVLIKKK